MPLLLLLFAFFVFSEGREKVLALFHFTIGIGMHDLGKIFHKPEVGPHSISKTSELAKLWNESYLISSLPVLVDKERLIWIRDSLIVPSLVVVLIAHLGTLLVKSS